MRTVLSVLVRSFFALLFAVAVYSAVWVLGYQLINSGERVSTTRFGDTQIDLSILFDYQIIGEEPVLVTEVNSVNDPVELKNLDTDEVIVNELFTDGYQKVFRLRDEMSISPGVYRPDSSGELMLEGRVEVLATWNRGTRSEFVLDGLRNLPNDVWGLVLLGIFFLIGLVICWLIGLIWHR